MRVGSLSRCMRFMVAGLLALAAQAALASTWQLVRLPSLGGPGTTALRLNNKGAVVGCSMTTAGMRHAFIYLDGVMRDLGPGIDSGDGNSCAYAVNDNGLVVGMAEATGEVVAWQDGRLLHLGFQGRPYGVNNAGVIVGYRMIDGVAHAFIYSNGSVMDPGSLNGGNGSIGTVADAINNRGQVVGGSRGRAFLYDMASGTMTDVSPPDSPYCTPIAHAVDINDLGQMAGLGPCAATTYVYDGNWDTISYSDAVAINGTGQYVYWQEGAYGVIADLDGSSLQRLSQLPDVRAKGWNHLEVADVNDQRWVIGAGEPPDGGSGAYLLKVVDALPAPHRQLADFDGDGIGDLVFTDADGRVEVRLLQGTSVVRSGTFAPSAPGHVIGATGDFNGDGKTDLLFRRDDGAVEMWSMDGTSLVGITTIMPAGTAWNVAHVGDFDGDGKSDILWRNGDGSVGAWLMDGPRVAARSTLMPPGAQWRPALVGDFNGDGTCDIVWQASDGAASIWMMLGTQPVYRYPMLPSGSLDTPIAAGDFDGDGAADIVLQRTDGSVRLQTRQPGSGSFFVSVSPEIMPANPNWTVSHVADFNGDGKSDLVWSGRDGAVGLWLMSSASVLERRTEMPAGTGWTASVAQDLSGDRKADLVWTHSSGAAGEWLMDGTSQVQRMPLEPPGSTKRLVPVEFGK